MANPNPNTSGLIPWKPGQSGNPGGRSRKVRLDDLLRDIMARETADKDGNPTGETVGEQFLWRILNHAMAEGNPSLIRELFDRHDGKLPDPPKPADGGPGKPADPTDMLIPDDDERHPDDGDAPRVDAD